MTPRKRFHRSRVWNSFFSFSVFTLIHKLLQQECIRQATNSSCLENFEFEYNLYSEHCVTVLKKQLHDYLSDVSDTL